MSGTILSTEDIELNNKGKTHALVKMTFDGMLDGEKWYREKKTQARKQNKEYFRPILNRMIQENITEKVIFKEIPEGSEGASHILSMGRQFQVGKTADEHSLR